jgi:endonuclease-8
MPEGPSLYIAREEMEPAIGKKVLAVNGNSRLPIETLKGQTLEEIGTWGKHLLLFFSDCVVRIHFLLWGSYSVNTPKENRSVRLSLKFQKITIYFYASSIKFLEEDVDKLYDWSADIMSPSWDAEAAFTKIKKKPNEMVCDVLMDQEIFSGVGNIIKNEVLFLQRLLPQRKVKSSTEKELRALIEETHQYTWKFYEWKKKYELRKHWLIMRKKTCPICGGPVTREETGKRKRLSHYCKHCQH